MRLGLLANDLPGTRDEPVQSFRNDGGRIRPRAGSGEPSQTRFRRDLGAAGRRRARKARELGLGSLGTHLTRQGLAGALRPTERCPAQRGAYRRTSLPHGIRSSTVRWRARCAAIYSAADYEFRGPDELSMRSHAVRCAAGGSAGRSWGAECPEEPLRAGLRREPDRPRAFRVRALREHERAWRKRVLVVQVRRVTTTTATSAQTTASRVNSLHRGLLSRSCTRRHSNRRRCNHNRQPYSTITVVIHAEQRKRGGPVDNRRHAGCNDYRQLGASVWCSLRETAGLDISLTRWWNTRRRDQSDPHPICH
jgi:hypothetical protein